MSQRPGHFRFSARGSDILHDVNLFEGMFERYFTSLPHLFIMSGTSASSQGQFNWPYFVQRRRWFPQNFGGPWGYTITAFEVAWSNQQDHAVFVGTRSDEWTFTVNPRARTQEREFSWGADNVSES